MTVNFEVNNCRLDDDIVGVNEANLSDDSALSNINKNYFSVFANTILDNSEKK